MHATGMTPQLSHAASSSILGFPERFESSGLAPEALLEQGLAAGAWLGHPPGSSCATTLSQQQLLQQQHSQGQQLLGAVGSGPKKGQSHLSSSLAQIRRSVTDVPHGTPHNGPHSQFMSLATLKEASSAAGGGPGGAPAKAGALQEGQVEGGMQAGATGGERAGGGVAQGARRGSLDLGALSSMSVATGSVPGLGRRSRVPLGFSLARPVHKSGALLEKDQGLSASHRALRLLGDREGGNAASSGGGSGGGTSLARTSSVPGGMGMTGLLSQGSGAAPATSSMRSLTGSAQSLGASAAQLAKPAPIQALVRNASEAALCTMRDISFSVGGFGSTAAEAPDSSNMSSKDTLNITMGHVSSGNALGSNQKVDQPLSASDPAGSSPSLAAATNDAMTQAMGSYNSTAAGTELRRVASSGPMATGLQSMDGSEPVSWFDFEVHMVPYPVTGTCDPLPASIPPFLLPACLIALLPAVRIIQNAKPALAAWAAFTRWQKKDNAQAHHPPSDLT